MTLRTDNALDRAMNRCGRAALARDCVLAGAESASRDNVAKRAAGFIAEVRAALDS